MAAEEMRIVYTTSNNTPGWIPGRVYQGRIEGKKIVYDYGEAPNGIEVTPYDSETKKSIETGFDVAQIPGVAYPPPYEQDTLEKIYIMQNRDSKMLDTASALIALKNNPNLGGRKRKTKRKRSKRKTKRRK
jgi:hypothetical protein